LEETLKLSKAKLGPDHPTTLSNMNNLALAYLGVGKLDLALPLFEETLKLKKTKLGPGHPETLATMSNLFAVYGEAGETAKAAQLVADAREQLPKDSPQLAQALAADGLALLKAKAFAEAEPMLRECLTIRARTEPDVWTTFNARSLLGGALLGQKQYTDAEPPLLKGYEGMKQREKSITAPNRMALTEALDRLIELYTATNKPDEVKKWQAERAKYPETKPAEKK
jgi:tetratricopeptide (TPR) repeat protein